MPLPSAPHGAPPLPRRLLLALTAAVGLAHWALLGGLPAGFRLLQGTTDSPVAEPAIARFVTRTVPPESTPARPPVPPKKPLPAREPAPAATQMVEVAAAEPTPIAPAPAAVAEAPPAALPAPAAIEKPADPAPPASALAPATAAASAAEVQHARAVKYPGPVVLQYDGRGEEGGYKKYAASGELLWQPDTLQYNAKLEISALFFRVRTWTSKGELTEGGLQPVRFGDKPRGAERAAHFQRDKGIISFSANNPDVPLQPGAQDKLSALIQLSAIVAGEPEHYPAGSSIRFQAADAHRAEIWDFRAAAPEDLDLPGGTLRTIPFTKDPTAEFDQRIDVWLATTLQYLPVRIRVTESNGNFVDLLWRKTQTLP